MSKLSLKGNPSGTGNFTIEAPNSNTDRTLALPDEAGTLATVENLPAGYTDTDALDLFNVTGSAPVYACRAWVNFDGTGTVSIRESGNVSSITDNGAGDYTINFSTAMPDSNFSWGGNCVENASAGGRSDRLLVGHRSSPSSSFVRVSTINSNFSKIDVAFIFVQAFR